MPKPKPLDLGFASSAGRNAYQGAEARWVLSGSRAGGGGALVPAIAPVNSAWKTAIRNIRMSFPNESDAWHREVRRESFVELGRMTGEFPHMGKFLDKYRNGDVLFEGRERVEATVGKGAVFIGGHFTIGKSHRFAWLRPSNCHSPIAPPTIR